MQLNTEIRRLNTLSVVFYIATLLTLNLYVVWYGENVLKPAGCTLQYLTIWLLSLELFVYDAFIPLNITVLAGALFLYTARNKCHTCHKIFSRTLITALLALMCLMFYIIVFVFPHDAACS
ncbi:MAG: hypothetical protein HN790_08270 [Methylococcales bacterium]|jgi:hypothetical protein|nr:hypothetical protein [Methylococcales bacterium]